MAKMTLEKAAQFKAAVKRATPGVKALDDELKRRGRCGEPIRTWGGRLYYCEPPSIAKKGARKGQEVTWEYKLLNYLVQGSAADAPADGPEDGRRGGYDGSGWAEVHVSGVRPVVPVEAGIGRAVGQVQVRAGDDGSE